MNSNISTQLLSMSLHKVIRRCNSSNKLANLLVTLNEYQYFDDCVRNITVRKEDQEMSFIPAGKPTSLSPEGYWSKEGRQTGKYGKILRKVVSDLLPHHKIIDKELEEIVNLVKSSFSLGEFIVVAGEDIRHWYHHENYNFDESLGSLGESCMRHDKCQRYFKIYEENPQVVSMIILRDGMGLIGRALVWKTANGVTFMDRIYGSDSTIVKFKQYAVDNGWHYKREQSYHNPTHFCDSGGNYLSPMNLSVSINDIDVDDYLPYLDTMCYLDADRGILYNYPADGARYLLRDTGGTCEEGREYALDVNTYLFDSMESIGYVEDVGYVRACEIVYCSFSNRDILEVESMIIACGATIHEDFDGEENEDIVLLADGRQCRRSRAKTCALNDELYYRGDITYVEQIDKYIHVDHVDEAIAQFSNENNNE